MEYKYKISVVSAVYNVSEFIREALDSLIDQDIQLKNIQLVLVNDGSTDNSGEICDEYKRKYPDNIVVVHKENGGQAEARRVGMDYVEGKYVSFFDPDDILEKKSFSSIYKFFEENYDEVDIVSMPIYFFGDLRGPHPLNNKFSKGTRVIDLTKETEVAQMSMASAVFKEGVARKIGADAELVTAEDAKELAKALIEKQKLGVVAEAKYLYRKRGTSTVGQAQFKSGWYVTYLTNFSEYVLKYSMEKLGYVPRFLQYTIVYDLQWKIKLPEIKDGVLTDEEKMLYQEKLYSLMKYFDDDIILCQKSISSEYKLYMLYRKYGIAPTIISMAQNPNEFFFNFKNVSLFEPERLAVFIDQIDVNEKSVTLEGRYTVPFIGIDDISVEVLSGKEYYPVEHTEYVEKIKSAGIDIGKRQGFKVTVPLSDESKKTITVSYNCGNKKHVKRIISFGKYSPVHHSASFSYYYSNGFILRPRKNGIDVCKSAKYEHIKLEIKYIKELLKSNSKEKKKAGYARILYNLLKKFVPKNIWLVCDKADRADDNGEAFFTYLVNNKNKHCYPIFLLSKESHDFERMSKIGKVVPYMSWQHKFLHLFAKHTISAYSHDEISSPFLDRTKYYADILKNNKVVFLQHGIIKDDLSPQLNKRIKNFALFVTSTEKERNSVLSYNYGYNQDEIILTGLPRYDRLYDNPQRIITVMPTWSRSLVESYDNQNSQWKLIDNFEESDYYKFYSKLLNSEKLLNYADSKDCKVAFLVHPVFIHHVDRFKFDPRVMVYHKDVIYRDVFATSSLVLTDYSSAVFDFVYLKKPVIYTHFEKNHYEEGYFNYETDGFGEIETTVEATVDRIIEYIDDDFRMKEKYAMRLSEFFVFSDKNNCERVYNEIVRLENQNE